MDFANDAGEKASTKYVIKKIDLNKLDVTVFANNKVSLKHENKINCAFKYIILYIYKSIRIHIMFSSLAVLRILK